MKCSVVFLVFYRILKVKIKKFQNCFSGIRYGWNEYNPETENAH